MQKDAFIKAKVYPYISNDESSRSKIIKVLRLAGI